MREFQGEWLFVIIAWYLLHVIVFVIASVLTIELIDWAPPCRRAACVAAGEAQ